MFCFSFKSRNHCVLADWQLIFGSMPRKWTPFPFAVRWSFLSTPNFLQPLVNTNKWLGNLVKFIFSKSTGSSIL